MFATRNTKRHERDFVFLCVFCGYPPALEFRFPLRALLVPSEVEGRPLW